MDSYIYFLGISLDKGYSVFNTSSDTPNILILSEVGSIETLFLCFTTACVCTLSSIKGNFGSFLSPSPSSFSFFFLNTFYSVCSEEKGCCSDSEGQRAGGSATNTSLCLNMLIFKDLIKTRVRALLIAYTNFGDQFVS